MHRTIYERKNMFFNYNIKCFNIRSNLHIKVCDAKYCKNHCSVMQLYDVIITVIIPQPITSKFNKRQAMMWKKAFTSQIKWVYFILFGA